MVFETAMELFGAGHPIDAATVGSELAKKGLLEAAGGWPQINHITDLLPTTAHRAYYIQQVRDAQVRRELSGIAAKAIEECQNSTEPTGELVNGIAQEILMLTASRADKEKTVAEAATVAIEDANRAFRGEKPAGISIDWPWPSFNRFALPIMQHELVIICARPSQGKSSIGLQLVSAAMAQGLRVLHFTLETSTLQCVRQMAAQQAGVNLQQLDRQLREGQQGYLKALQSIGNSPLLRIADRAMRLDDIAARCRIMRETWKPQMVMVDYLQLIQSPGGSRYEQITNASNRMMELRKQLDCPFVVLAQLSRANQADGRAPQLSDLRDSGAIEQDASRVVALHRPETDFSGIAQVGEGAMENRAIYDQYLMQLKHREGPTFNAKIKFHAPTTRFYEE